VIVVAPLENYSGIGHGINLNGPIYVERVQMPGAQSATGLATTPASAVRVALTTLLDTPPDLLVSGVNPGFNFGLNAYISGTVGAAREGAMRGIASIAVSQDIRAGRDFTPAAAVAARVAAIVKRGGLPPGVFLNVSVPMGPSESMKGLRLARQSRMMGSERFEESRTASGRRLFWPVFEQPTTAETGSDIQAVLDGYVAVTPLRAYEGDEAALDSLRTRFDP
jgi:5'-nucleotidase